MTIIYTSEQIRALRAAMIGLMGAAHSRCGKAQLTLACRVALGGYCGRCTIDVDGLRTKECGRKDCSYEYTRDYVPPKCERPGCEGHVGWTEEYVKRYPHAPAYNHYSRDRRDGCTCDRRMWDAGHNAACPFYSKES